MLVRSTGSFGITTLKQKTKKTGVMNFHISLVYINQFSNPVSLLLLFCLFQLLQVRKEGKKRSTWKSYRVATDLEEEPMIDFCFYFEEIFWNISVCKI